MRRTRWALLAAVLAMAPAGAQGQEQVCPASAVAFRVGWGDDLSAASRYRVLYPDSTRTAHQAVDTSLGVALGALAPGDTLGVGFNIRIYCTQWLTPGEGVDAATIADLQARIDSLLAVIADLNDTGPAPSPASGPIATELSTYTEGGGTRLGLRWKGPEGTTWRVTLNGTETNGSSSGGPTAAGYYWMQWPNVPTGELCVQGAAPGGSFGTPACITIGGSGNGQPGEATVVALRVLPATFTIELPAGQGQVNQAPTTQRVDMVADASDGRPYTCQAGQLVEALLTSSGSPYTSKPDQVAVRPGGATLPGPCAPQWCIDNPSVATLALDDGTSAPMCPAGGGSQLVWRGRTYLQSPWLVRGR